MSYQQIESRAAVMIYAERRLGERRYRYMTLAERGLYISMVFECWKNGSVPADLRELAAYLAQNVDEVTAAATDRCLSLFEQIGSDLICPEIEEYRAEMLERSRRKRQAGSKGGKVAAASRSSSSRSTA